MQVMGTEDWVAGLSKALQLAGYASQQTADSSSFRASTLDRCVAGSEIAGRGPGMVVILSLAQPACRVPGNAWRVPGIARHHAINYG